LSSLNSGPVFDNHNYDQSWVVRNGFSHWIVAVSWLFVAFLLFQLVAGLIAFGLIYFAGEVESFAEFETALTERLDLLFVGNSFGQIAFLGLCTLLVARIHLSGESLSTFMRFKWNDKTPLYMVLAGVLFLAVQPAVVYIGYLNSLLPVPDLFSDLQAGQYQMFADFLATDGAMWLALFHIALVPSFAEEVLFRSYVLRAFEKSWGIVLAIVISGILFGLYHIQLTNLLPLATLGILLAVITWLSGSVWPAVLAHFVNNGAAVLAGTYYPEIAFAQMSAEALPPFWMFIASVVISAIVIRYMYVYSNEKLKTS